MTTNHNSSHSKANDNAWAENLAKMAETFGTAFLLIVKEIAFGLYFRPKAVLKMALYSVLLFKLIEEGYDYKLLHYFGLTTYYPRNHTLYAMYLYFVGTCPLWIWGMVQNWKRRSMERKLEGIFLSAGLSNRLGHTPKFSSDIELQDGVRRIRLKRSHYSLKDIQKAKASIEAGLGAYVDEITEDRDKQTVDILYSKTPMPEVHKLGGPSMPAGEFLVGVTRSRYVGGDLKETPHLLIAGQTGGGKSTFLRQLISTLFLSNPDMEFTLIDLKGGLEFQLFEGLPRVKVIPSLEEAKASLKIMESKIQSRMNELKSKGLNHIDAKSSDGKPGASFNRHVIVVDEAAEIFLPGNTYGAEHYQAIRVILNRVARQGRAVGIHLVVATQRPDVKSLDPQVKANLTGILCFQMPNDTASLTVLDSGRATDLPSIPGRAIWKVGAQMTELQTPYYSEEEAKREFAHIRKKANTTKPDQTSKNDSKQFEIVV